MLVVRDRVEQKSRRRQTGSQIVEFGAALALLTTVLLLPLIDLAIVPIRWMMAQGMVSTCSRRLALCETFSQSCKMVAIEPSILDKLHGLGGISVQSEALQLRISRMPPHSGEFMLVSTPGKIAPEWLPNGANAPCQYSLELNINLLIAPAVMLRIPGRPIPGLSAPFPIIITSVHEWENLGRNPATSQYFLNE